jgi:unsaturated pyranuronate lyase
MEPQFVSLSELRRFTLAEGVSAQALFGESAMLNLVELAPDAVVPRHSHPHEQLGVVLRGELNLMVAGREHHLREMGAYTLPGGLEHQARAGPEGALVLDVFQPVREEYRELRARTDASVRRRPSRRGSLRRKAKVGEGAVTVEVQGEPRDLARRERETGSLPSPPSVAAPVRSSCRVRRDGRIRADVAAPGVRRIILRCCLRPPQRRTPA